MDAKEKEITCVHCLRLVPESKAIQIDNLWYCEEDAERFLYRHFGNKDAPKKP